MTGAARIAAERQRQIDVEGYTTEHDAEHDAGELTDAGIYYAWLARGQMTDSYRPLMLDFPWHESAWKPSDDPIRNLEKAGALIAAEIDRLQASLPPEPTKEPQ
jgi:hypothetical protein